MVAVYWHNHIFGAQFWQVLGGWILVIRNYATESVQYVPRSVTVYVGSFSAAPSLIQPLPPHAQMTRTDRKHPFQKKLHY